MFGFQPPYTFPSILLVALDGPGCPLLPLQGSTVPEDLVNTFSCVD